MEQGRWLEIIERFWLDVIGTAVPGAMLFMPVTMALAPLFPRVPIPPATSFEWVLLVIGSYAVGHVVSSVGGWTDIVAGRLLSFMGVKSHKAIADEMAASPQFERFERAAETAATASSIERLRTVRSLVMTALRDTDRHSVYRFMFLALFCRGAATAVLLVLPILVVLALTYQDIRLSQGDRVALGLALACAPFLMERASYFLEIALRVPFAMNVGLELGRVRIVDSERRDRRTCVYLAGGFHSGWQDEVISGVPGIEWRDPRSHGLDDPAAYIAWDLRSIRESDVVFACLEPSNPGLYSLSLELGFARALNKHLIVVDLAGFPETTSKYLEMCRQIADVKTANVQDGIASLSEYIRRRGIV